MIAVVDGQPMRVVDNMELVSKIQEAIIIVRKGICKRVDVNSDIKVYRCGGVIRIDIKDQEVN